MNKNEFKSCANQLYVFHLEYAGLIQTNQEITPERLSKLQAKYEDIIDSEYFDTSTDQGLIHQVGGEIYLLRKEFEKAKNAFQNAGELRSDFLIAYLGKADACIGLGELTEARDTYEYMLTQIDPDKKHQLIVAITHDLAELDKTYFKIEPYGLLSAQMRYETGLNSAKKIVDFKTAQEYFDMVNRLQADIDRLTSAPNLPKQPASPYLH